MSDDDKSQANTRQAKPDGEASTGGPMPFQEMMAEMMAQCGSCCEQMGIQWAGCCGTPPEKEQDPKKA